MAQCQYCETLDKGHNFQEKEINPACSRYLLETVFLLQFPAQLDCVPKCVQIWENAEVEQIANDVCHAKYF